MKVETPEDVLFPGLDLVVKRAVVADGGMMIDAAGCGSPGACPQCRHPAARVHSRYWRHIAGLPVGVHRLIVRLRVRRFFCNQNWCRRRTFVEQVEGLTEPRRRSSTAARSAMRAVAVELGGRPGQRLCARLGLYGRRTTILGQLTAPPVPARAPQILGIDEFAFGKGHTYGTVLVDVESSRPVDVLPDRETGTVAAWIQEHPGAEIICRDRLMAFTKAIRQAAPNALEVADRWHLLQNLSTAIEKTCRRHRDCLRRPTASESTTALVTPETALWTGSDDATRRSTSLPPPVCRSTPSAAVYGWTARRSGATGTRTLKGFSPRRKTTGTVSSTHSSSTSSTASRQAAPVQCSSIARCSSSATPADITS
ncbi:ISL3 family transposase [Streptomyces sp. 147326]|uniref:ISL3 family transposase n=1 Tax=Streptomyces sp. 147326 TaxID=3074379 RepID=UPI0038573298